MADGANLKRILDEKETNIRRLARKTGITASTLYTIVKRDSDIRFDWAIRIADALGITPGEICSKWNDAETDISTPEKIKIQNAIGEISSTFDYLHDKSPEGICESLIHETLWDISVDLSKMLKSVNDLKDMLSVKETT